MFKKIINHEGFWKSVVSIGIAFVVLFCVFKWILDSFSFAFITNNPLRFTVAIVLAGFVYGFLVTYGKFWKKLKEKSS
ncbi:MAG: hypothetical protein R2793_01245 [Flavobacteriaceae bacterium]